MIGLKSKAMFQTAGAVSLLIAVGGGGARCEDFVAGVDPSRRPANAPAITRVEHSDAWKRAATRGIGEPLPTGLKFLEDQGAWYTPFTGPGMPGRYDIRTLHSAPAGAKAP